MATSPCLDGNRFLTTTFELVIAPAASRYEADEKSPGIIYGPTSMDCMHGIVNWVESVNNFTPAFFSISIVISTYGLDFSSPSTRIVVSFSTNGHASNKPEINCELIDPSTVVLPPLSLPLTTIGAVPSPLVENATAPSSFIAFNKGIFGRLRKDASPVKTAAPSIKPAMAIINLSVVPELAASITFSGVVGCPSTPLILKTSSFPSMMRIVAPNASHA